MVIDWDLSTHIFQKNKLISLILMRNIKNTYIPVSVFYILDFYFFKSFFPSPNFLVTYQSIAPQTTSHSSTAAHARLTGVKVKPTICVTLISGSAAKRTRTKFIPAAIKAPLQIPIFQKRGCLSMTPARPIMAPTIGYHKSTPHETIWCSVYCPVKIMVTKAASETIKPSDFAQTVLLRTAGIFL